MMEADAVQVAQNLLITFAIIFTAGAVAAKLAAVLKIPDVVLFLLIGLVLGPPGLNLVSVLAQSALNQLLLILGAAFLLFHGGTSVSFKVLRQVWRTLLLLATLAVLIMVVIVGYAAHYALGLSLISAFLLAAVIASTDPATLVPIFLAIKVKDKVAQTVLSESAFNDATGAIATFAILSILTTGQVSIGDSLLRFVVMAGGGIAVGAGFGFIAAAAITDKAAGILGEMAQLLVLPVIIAAYLTAEHIGGSGFMAVFVVGLIHGNLDAFGWQMRPEHQASLDSFIDHASLILRMFIFLLLGTHIDFDVVWRYLGSGLIVVVVFMIVARPLAVLACTLPDRSARWRRNEIVFMFWTRETGVIPAALSGMLIGRGVEHAEIIAAVTFLAILATLVIQASTTKWLARKLGLLEEAGRFPA